MNFLKAITTDGKTELFNVNNILSIQPNDNGETKILMGAGLVWWVRSDSIEWVNCYNDLVAAIKPKATKETHNFAIMSNDFEYTGGGIWVLFTEIYLPNEETTIYATTDDSYCMFYYNKENYDECENPDYEIYCDNIEDATPKYRDIARVLFTHFDINFAKHEG